jgi:hypothetical protein
MAGSQIPKGVVTKPAGLTTKPTGLRTEFQSTRSLEGLLMGRVMKKSKADLVRNSLLFVAKGTRNVGSGMDSVHPKSCLSSPFLSKRMEGGKSVHQIRLAFWLSQAFMVNDQALWCTREHRQIARLFSSRAPTFRVFAPDTPSKRARRFSPFSCCDDRCSRTLPLFLWSKFNDQANDLGHEIGRFRDQTESVHYKPEIL